MEQKTGYEIRVYNERFNMDEDYYMGDTDIKQQVLCNNRQELIKTWEKLLKTEEGETYSVWDCTTNEIIVGGAFDPNDIDEIEYYFDEECE